jgi:hypothetical protein
MPSMIATGVRSSRFVTSCALIAVVSAYHVHFYGEQEAQYHGLYSHSTLQPRRQLRHTSRASTRCTFLPANRDCIFKRPALLSLQS